MSYVVYSHGVVIRRDTDPIERMDALEWEPYAEASELAARRAAKLPAADVSEAAGPWRAIPDVSGYDMSATTRTIRSWRRQGGTGDRNGRASTPKPVGQWLAKGVLSATLRTASGSHIRRSIDTWYRLTWGDAQ